MMMGDEFVGAAVCDFGDDESPRGCSLGNFKPASSLDLHGILI